RGVKLALPLFVYAAVTLSAVTAHAVCPGDCNADGRVSIDELVLGTQVALGAAESAVCPSLFSGCGQGVCIDDLVRAVGNSVEGCALPALASSDPAPDAIDVPATAWIVLRFAEPVDPASIGSLVLDCGVFLTVEKTVVGESTVVVNPGQQLPGSTRCQVTSLRMAAGFEFTTAATA